MIHHWFCKTAHVRQQHQASTWCWMAFSICMPHQGHSGNGIRGYVMVHLCNYTRHTYNSMYIDINITKYHYDSLYLYTDIIHIHYIYIISISMKYDIYHWPCFNPGWSMVAFPTFPSKSLSLSNTFFFDQLQRLHSLPQTKRQRKKIRCNQWWAWKPTAVWIGYCSLDQCNSTECCYAEIHLGWMSWPCTYLSSSREPLAVDVLVLSLPIEPTRLCSFRSTYKLLMIYIQVTHLVAY